MILNIEHVSKSYEGHQALHDITLNVQPGSIFGLLGPNGAGKTSLIRIITRITHPDSGNILFKGMPLAQEHVFRMGYLPEERGLYKKMKVAEQLLYFAELKGLSQSEAKRRLKKWVDAFGMKDWLGKKVEELSKGMQQKVQFVATVLHEPDLLILDEPFSGFDPLNAQMVTDEILRMKSNGTSILFSTHRMDSVEQLCDEIALINRSRSILQGPVHAIKNQYRSNRYVVKHSGALTNSHLWNVQSAQPIAGDQWRSELVLLTQDTNLALRSLLDSTQIISFEEYIPSMEEIFIQAVQSQQ